MPSEKFKIKNKNPKLNQKNSNPENVHLNKRPEKKNNAVEKIYLSDFILFMFSTCFW